MQTITYRMRDHQTRFRVSVRHAWVEGQPRTLCGRSVPDVVHRLDSRPNCRMCIQSLEKKKNMPPVLRISRNQHSEAEVRAAVREFRARGGIIHRHEPDPRFAGMEGPPSARPMNQHRNAGGGYGIHLLEPDGLEG